MKSVITAMEDDAVVRHGQKLCERNFVVDGLRSNDLVHDVATMKYAGNGAYIGQSSGTARVSQSLLARR